MSRRYHYPNAWNDDGARYTFDQHVDDIAAFIRALNVGKVHLVGNSYSGRLAGYVALKYPELLRSVVLGEPSLAAPAHPEGKAAMAAFARDINTSATAAKAGRPRESAILLANAVLGDPAGFDKWTPVRQARWLENERTMLPMYSGAGPKPVTCEQLNGLRVPVLIVRGEKTRDSYRYGHEALVACLGSKAASAVIPNAMHPWGSDEPEVSARVIRAFIAKH